MKRDADASSADFPTASEFIPAGGSLTALRSAAAHCQGCPLYERATQTVFGEGKRQSDIVLVGEQPGDQEDLAGHPFVGPAGRLLDEVLAEVGINRETVYVTNAVKHFKWVERGKRRLHAKPSSREIQACRPWLEAEFAAIEPRLIVCLGATAAQALLGRGFRITRSRGQLIESAWAPWTLATYHPSAVLRAPDSAQRKIMRQEFAADLRTAAEAIANTKSYGGHARRRAKSK